ncbi:MAG: asparagine synthase (glutamine-hydrolyzing) [Pyrinomonadaceae bacterium]|nr:asparagine synthase (glutamine-hydrolyzing) [Pyrinomonadaceae bacterium]
MCGIAGIAGSTDQNAATESVKRMTNSLSHRGPDAEGIFTEDGIALGHRRLSIIDLSEAANQPLYDETGRFVLILNGEIYNYRELKKDLAAYPFKTDSDTEVILAAYAKYGTECLSRLNGMFAFAIWDRRDKDLFIARDRIGVKPLYYALSGGKLLFASEIRAILDTGLVDRSLNPRAVREYLMFQSVYSPETIVKDIRQLPAGHFARYADGRLTISKYWDLTDTKGSPLNGDPQAIKTEVRRLFKESVERRLVSDVTLGAFLSGGIDSSAVVGMMAELSSDPVTTFSITFSEEKFDESKYSDLVAQRFGTHHHRVKLSAKDFLEELPSALRAMDSPSGDGLNTYVVSKATKNAGITVALSGLGGDELFAGYSNFLQWYRLRHSPVQRVPRTLRASAGALMSMSSNTKHHRIADILASENVDIQNIYPMLRQVLSAKTSGELAVNKNGYESIIQQELEVRIEQLNAMPVLSQFTVAELLGYTQNVLLKDTDQFSMASALEVREPFFDYHLVEYVLRIPDEIKYPRFAKSLFVDALAPMLPDEIVHRPKMGFVLPWDAWMRNELRSFCDLRIDRLGKRGILDRGRLTKLWDRFISGDPRVLWSHVWHTIVLDEWLENNHF